MVNTTRKLRKSFVGTMVVVLVALLAMPAFAAAQATTDDQYRGTNDRVDTLAGGGAGGSGDAGALESTVGPLPFTGFDVIAMLAVALAVTGLGLALQRAVARQPSEL